MSNSNQHSLDKDTDKDTAVGPDKDIQVCNQGKAVARVYNQGKVAQVYIPEDIVLVSFLGLHTFRQLILGTDS